jgi:hypothetical protein
MKKSLLTGLVAIIAFSACRHKKEVVQVTTISAPENFVVSTSADSASSTNYRLIVSFYSIGEGPDSEAHIKFVNYLDNYKREKNKAISTEETPWGREGEVDYCMKLKELTASEQSDFIANLKIALSVAKWVNFLENKPCKRRQN